VEREWKGKEVMGKESLPHCFLLFIGVDALANKDLLIN